MKISVAIVVVAILCSGCLSNNFKATYDHSEARPNYGACCLFNSSQGLFSSVLNENSRCNSEISLNWVKIYSGKQESIGQAIEFNGGIYFPAEGNGVVYRNGKINDSLYLRHSSAAIVYKNQPCFVASLSDGEYVVNGDTGARLYKFPVPAQVGIPFAADYLPNSSEIITVLADDNGKEQLATTTGVLIPLPQATSVVNWDGTIMAGAAGVIYKVDVDNKSVKKYYDTGSHIIDYMWYDKDNNVLWVCCSGMDKLLTFGWTGTFWDWLGNDHEVYACNDGSPAGRMFGGRVTKGWWSRDCNIQAQWFKVEKR